jgi:hypothetical protein
MVVVRHDFDAVGAFRRNPALFVGLCLMAVGFVAIRKSVTRGQALPDSTFGASIADLNTMMGAWGAAGEFVFRI